MNILKYRYCFIGTALIALDRFLKLWAENSCFISKKCTSFLSFELAHNTGVSFNLFASHNQYVYWLLTIAITSLLIVFARVMMQRSKAGHVVIGEALIVAGGFGNVCDRVWYGYVIDFIHVHYKSWSYPHFNVADMCIVIGVCIILGQLFLEQKSDDCSCRC